MDKIVIILLFILNLNAIEVDLKNKNLQNRTAYITSQCYTKTEDENNENILHNPCFSCHTKNKIPNFTLYDDNLQEAYDFPASALKNPWINLFKDRTKEIALISDKKIMDYVRQDNYKKLSTKLNNIPKSWDSNDNGRWDGYTPDCLYSFDDEGFDRADDGSFTGWRAFAYYPFLGTFWPTNGSTDDVLIRLSKDFQQNQKGVFDIEVYRLNLSIVESLVKQKSIDIHSVDERRYGVDLNQNGKLDISSQIVFEWKKPEYDIKNGRLYNFSMSYVGLAKHKLMEGKLHIAPGLYPVKTEFLHSVRYVDVDANQDIKMASRMKELRYGVKTSWQSYSDLKEIGAHEIKEKFDFPDRVDQFVGDIELGLSNQRGWLYQGFIEDKQGELRPQSYEETLYCMGCHSNLGATADSTFVFNRKFENSFQEGWYHWSQKGFKNIADRVLENGDSEYVSYLKANNAGDEFRQNTEVMDKFFKKDWQKDTKNIEKDLISKLENSRVVLAQEWKLKKESIKKLKQDISYLILPTPKRAIELNKAYRVIVDEQSFIYGRDATIKPAKNVHKEVKDGQSTNLEKIQW